MARGGRGGGAPSLVAAVAACAAALAASAPAPLPGQQPRPADVATLDGILAAYYEAVSGPAGSVPDRARDRTLHHPDALVGIAGVDDHGRPTLLTTDLDGYHDRFGGPRQAPFYEWEIHREVQRFGSVAHVWSSYATSDRPGGEPRGRGVNSIQLHWDGSRWWILGWVFDSERAGNPLPAAYDGPGPGPTAEVVAAVQRFFDAMAAGDVAASRAVLAPGARFHSVRDEGGTRTTRSQTDEEYLDDLAAAGGGAWAERMWDPRVEVRGDVASLWAPYDFHVDGVFSHCGVDAFTLVRADGRWMITGVTYTVEREGCAPPPAGG